MAKRKKCKRTNNDLQNIHIKLKIEKHKPHWLKDICVLVLNVLTKQNELLLLLPLVVTQPEYLGHDYCIDAMYYNKQIKSHNIKAL
jgi:hypothetical protein